MKNVGKGFRDNLEILLSMKLYIHISEGLTVRCQYNGKHIVLTG